MQRTVRAGCCDADVALYKEAVGRGCIRSRIGRTNDGRALNVKLVLRRRRPDADAALYKEPVGRGCIRSRLGRTNAGRALNVKLVLRRRRPDADGADADEEARVSRGTVGE